MKVESIHPQLRAKAEQELGPKFDITWSWGWGVTHRRSPLNSTMSLLTATRTMASRFPSRDHLKSPIGRLSVKRVSWRAAPPSSG